MKMTVADFKSIITKQMNERDMIYVIVGDKATQLEAVRQLKGAVTLLDSNGNRVN
jgi:zinc protease